MERTETKTCSGRTNDPFIPPVDLIHYASSPLGAGLGINVHELKEEIVLITHPQRTVQNTMDSTPFHSASTVISPASGFGTALDSHNGLHEDACNSKGTKREGPEGDISDGSSVSVSSQLSDGPTGEDRPQISHASQEDPTLFKSEGDKRSAPEKIHASTTISSFERYESTRDQVSREPVVQRRSSSPDNSGTYRFNLGSGCLVVLGDGTELNINTPSSQARPVLAPSRISQRRGDRRRKTLARMSKQWMDPSENVVESDIGPHRTDKPDRWHRYQQSPRLARRPARDRLTGSPTNVKACPGDSDCVSDPTLLQGVCSLTFPSPSVLASNYNLEPVEDHQNTPANFPDTHVSHPEITLNGQSMCASVKGDGTDMRSSSSIPKSFTAMGEDNLRILAEESRQRMEWFALLYHRNLNGFMEGESSRRLAGSPWTSTTEFDVPPELRSSSGFNRRVKSEELSEGGTDGSEGLELYLGSRPYCNARPRPTGDPHG
ncbi:hypothetical protein TREMEDRAFT_61621 [Tremella mesenterica DSM 1558]|uniref:uncharacterized protein n=1 Tax=Tremella mesenterica (strain ATCC 24925 / CBS 8224 / DSM 1558 / NBRC 9311 / NRRL Y-6157 / RJB 2259-6 / UBC 559-6) TaxID=578456 RepID=UPI0003F4A204|nr:uncharacterized protein TREMEDRAFT_61621 [Tremella mesenterica DSM 1558]EIW69850.1 hypothetical protein TREMEDRAFT_61621 [Tremella mesenterica DSM 1558]